MGWPSSQVAFWVLQDEAGQGGVGTGTCVAKCKDFLIIICPGLGGMCGGFVSSSHEGESVEFSNCNQFCMEQPLHVNIYSSEFTELIEFKS